MRKLLIAGLCVVAVMAALPASAEPSSRRVSFEYEGPNSFAEPTGGLVIFGVYTNVKPRARERFVMVRVEDESGEPVAAAIHQGNHELGGTFCGATSRPRLLVNRRAVHVHLYVGEGCGGMSMPTQGTVTLTFSRNR